DPDADDSADDEDATRVVSEPDGEDGDEDAASTASSDDAEGDDAEGDGEDGGDAGDGDGDDDAAGDEDTTRGGSESDGDDGDAGADGDGEAEAPGPAEGGDEATRVRPEGSGAVLPDAAPEDVFALGEILWTAIVGEPPEIGPFDIDGPNASPLRETGAPADLG